MSTDQQNCLLRAALRTVELNDNLTERIDQCRDSLRAWNAAFSGTQQTEGNIVSHMSTQIFFFCIWFWVETWRDTTAMEVDRFESQFIYFTDLCEHFLDLHVAKTPFRNTFTAIQTQGPTPLNTPPAFSLGSGVVTCLVAAVEKCRNPVIRRRCLAILQRINLRGIFNTHYLVAYLQAIIETRHYKSSGPVESPRTLGHSSELQRVPKFFRMGREMIGKDEATAVIQIPRASRNKVLQHDCCLDIRCAGYPLR